MKARPSPAEKVRADVRTNTGRLLFAPSTAGDGVE
jgi:hypothetical protein